MSENLRDLVVSLSLNSQNFTRNITAVNKQIKEAESYFKLASAGVLNFESTTAGLASKLSNLERKVKLQKSVVDQYKKALESANGKLQECYTQQTEYGNRLTQAKQKQADLSVQITLASAKYEEYKNTLGETNSATLMAKANLDALTVEHGEATASVTKLAGQEDALKRATLNAADAVSRNTTNLNQSKSAMMKSVAEIEQTKQALKMYKAGWEKASTQIKTHDSALALLGSQLKLAQSQFNLATASMRGMTSASTQTSAKISLLRQSLALQQQEVTELTGKLTALTTQLKAAKKASDPKEIERLTKEVVEVQAALNNATATMRRTNNELLVTQSRWAKAGTALMAFGTKCASVGMAMVSMGRTMMLYVTTPLVALGASAIKASIDFESAFTGVRKTVDASEQQFTQLSNTVKRMSTEIATDTTQIANVMATAGQLGIETTALEDFTRVMVDLGNSTDIVAEEAASTLAKFANITGMDQSQFQQLGSALVDLGNNYATTESSIMEMAKRMAAAGTQVGLSEAQILGFSTAFSAVGLEAEMGGSAFSKALVKMEVASATGGKALEDFATVSGMSAEQFKVLWDSNPAEAFQSFIVGLSNMDDAGISAIATLQEIGIAEIRLRDTMLRAVNATELFADTQTTATNAWDANVALTEEAGKRYATTASQLTNLKNKAVLFGQQIGDDLNPLVRELIAGTSTYLDKLMALDTQEREQLIRTVAFVAALGPALFLLGKVTRSIGLTATGIGKFSKAVGLAGGGFSGFMTTLAKSPAFWLVLGTAVIAGTVALADYTSGAKEAREALEGMRETAEKWKETAATTFYGNSKGLSFFGMSTSDFVNEGNSAVEESQQWLSDLLAVWSDGKKETNDIVNGFATSFKEGTNSIRTGLSEMQTTAEEAGYTDLSTQMQADLDALDSMDEEIAKLLKRRKSKDFSEKDKLRLQELIDTREAIAIKYNLVPATTDTEGFDTIRKKIEAEVARANARGEQSPSLVVYQNAVVASAEGMAAINKQLDEQYDKEYALIQLMTDENEKQIALKALNDQYNADRKAAGIEYATLLKDIILPAWNAEGVQQAGTDIDALIAKLGEYSTATEGEKPAILTDLNTLTAGMDEGAVTEYIALLTQVQSLLDSGMTEKEVSDLIPIDFSVPLDQIAAIQTFLNGRETLLPGLTSMFGQALPEEILSIATDLDMTGVQARWEEFAANPGAITTDAIIAGIVEGETKPQIAVEAFISAYTEIPEGASTALLTPSGILAYVTKYAEVTTGADVSTLTPQHITAMVAGYKELAQGTDVSLLKPSEITAYISNYLEQQEVDTTGITPEGLTAFVVSYQEVTGGALTSALTPTDIAAMVTKYLVSENVDLSKVTDPQINALVNAYAEATNCDKSALKAEVVAQITAYEEAENVTKPSYIETQISITGYDLIAYRQFVRDNPIEVDGIVRLGGLYENPTEALNDPNATFVMDGVPIPVTAVPQELLTSSSLAVLDEDGTVHVLITPKATGSTEAVAEVKKAIDETDVSGATLLGNAIGIMPTTVMDGVDSAMERINSYLETKDLNGWDKFWAGVWGATTDKGSLDYIMQLNFGPDKIASLTTYVQELVTAIQSGAQVSEEDMTNLQSIVTFLQGLETAGVGENVTAGIGEALVATGWETDAESVASNLENALNKAFQIQSPSVRMHPVGQNIAAGVGIGFSLYNPSSDTNTLASKMKGSLTSSLDLRPVGTYAMAGLRAGIYAGRSGVVSAMRSTAKEAVNAAKQELKINSPSAVFRDEVGKMTMRGFSEGVLLESKEQAKAIQNASRFLTGEAKAGAQGYSNNDNRQTYNQQSTVNLTGNTFQVRDEKDIQSLASEIATLTKRQQRGRGFRT